MPRRHELIRRQFAKYFESLHRIVAGKHDAIDRPGEHLFVGRLHMSVKMSQCGREVFSGSMITKILKCRAM